MNPPVQSPVGEKPWNVASARTSNAVFAICEVNGKRVTALVDTGAAVTLIHRDIVDKARNASTKTRAATRAIVGANNSPLSVHLVAELDIKLGGIVVKHEVQVCDDLSQDMLVGTDILKPNKVVIAFGTGTLEAKGKRDNLVYKSSKEVCRVVVAETITVPPRSMTNITGKVDRGSVIDRMTGVLEQENRFEERYSTGILKVVATVKDGTIPIRIFNPQAKPRRIYRGSTIGQLCPLLDEDEEDTPTSYRVIQNNAQPESTTTHCMAAQTKDLKEVRREMATLFKIENPSISDNEKERV